jgi:hypothetical protein
MPTANDLQRDPVAGTKVPRAGKRSKDESHAAPLAQDTAESERRTQARESESALDRALNRMPPG